nr:hypothetical protein [uncultured Tyzzerella sp.]
MRKRKHKKSKQDNTLKFIVLLTAVLQLIQALVELLNKLFE